jgi:UDP-N-acetylglucosamine--N-acetylmuramyl-(pentapeptide) pyrophosphoryl-undecaprenol N-acetylglucosamine transferase
MKVVRIVLTGGGTGGHIFPLAAVADSLNEINKGNLEIFYLGPKSPLNEEFIKRDIPVFNISSAKWRRYLDIANLTDIPKFFWSLGQALFILFKLMPDVVFSKGGPGALPVVLAAKFYLIPIIIHESDSIPGLTNRISAKLAKRIAISFRKAAEFFPREKTVLIGQPIRTSLLTGLFANPSEIKKYLGFDEKLPLILVLGGSQGAAIINNFIVNNLESLIQEFQIYHQTGPANEKEIKILTNQNLNALSESLKEHYRCVGFLDLNQIKNALAAADVVISRAGAGAIFEIAAFGKPSIIIPITESANNHQLTNAYEYASTGAAIVVEEANFKLGIILRQIKNIVEDKFLQEEMSQAAKNFARPKAAQMIAEEILKLAAGKS